MNRNQLRIERAEIAIWRILKNIREYLTILYYIAQYWAIFGKILKYLTISSSIVNHRIPQKQTYTIPKFSVPLFFFTWASSRAAFAPKNWYKDNVWLQLRAWKIFTAMQQLNFDFEKSGYILVIHPDFILQFT